jgi:YHS domain-containing protein
VKGVLAVVRSSSKPGWHPGIYLMMKRDPVCKMDVDPSRAAATSTYKGDTYYFCSAQCKQRFDSDPESFVSRSERSQS